MPVAEPSPVSTTPPPETGQQQQRSSGSSQAVIEYLDGTIEVVNHEQVPPVLQKLQKWADYPSFGQRVGPTRFIPGKTPLAEEIVANWTLEHPPKHNHTVPLFLQLTRARGEHIGMFIDLSNHECLYSQDLPPDVEYRHIELVAKVYPSPKAIDLVIYTANEFWSRKPSMEIAIHCAYGFNRTGFVLCCYLIQSAGLAIEDALAAFAAARPPGIKHQSFIQELYRRYAPDRLPPLSEEGEDQELAAVKAMAEAASPTSLPASWSVPAPLEAAAAATSPCTDAATASACGAAPCAAVDGGDGGRQRRSMEFSGAAAAAAASGSGAPSLARHSAPMAVRMPSAACGRRSLDMESDEALHQALGDALRSGGEGGGAAADAADASAGGEYRRVSSLLEAHTPRLRRQTSESLARALAGDFLGASPPRECRLSLPTRRNLCRVLSNPEGRAAGAGPAAAGADAAANGDGTRREKDQGGVQQQQHASALDVVLEAAVSSETFGVAVAAEYLRAAQAASAPPIAKHQ